MKKSLLLLTCITHSMYSFEFKNFTNLFKKAETEAATKEFSLQPESTLSVTNNEGSITIKGWNHNKVIVESVKRGSSEHFKKVHITIDASPNHITIAPLFDKGVTNFPIDFVIMVPKNCALITAFIHKGSIKIKDCQSTLEVSTEYGPIAIHGSTKTVAAKTNSGNIKLKQKTLAENDTVFLETAKGHITVRLSPKINANLQAKTTNGIVSSSLYVTLEPQTTKLNKDMWARIKKEVNGTLGNGGAPITVDVSRGNITFEEL